MAYMHMDMLDMCVMCIRSLALHVHGALGQLQLGAKVCNSQAATMQRQLQQARGGAPRTCTPHSCASTCIPSHVHVARAWAWRVQARMGVGDGQRAAPISVQKIRGLVVAPERRAEENLNVSTDSHVGRLQVLARASSHRPSPCLSVSLFSLSLPPSLSLRSLSLASSLAFSRLLPPSSACSHLLPPSLCAGRAR